VAAFAVDLDQPVPLKAQELVHAVAWSVGLLALMEN
jgi:hypothetical protein